MNSSSRAGPPEADPYTPAVRFLGSLKTTPCDPASVKAFLLCLGNLPADIPILKNIAGLIRGDAPEGIITGRLERRYLRIRFVQEELGKLDFTQAGPGTAFEDFIFSRIDFSVYNKIDEKTFRLLYETGPDDYGDAFFEKNFRRSRGEIGDIIRRSYKKIGPFYYMLRRKAPPNPLLLSIMRTLQSSLEFLPLLSREEVLNECTGLIRFLSDRAGRGGAANPILGKEAFFYLAQSFGALFRCILLSLDQVTLIHDDGMETRLFTGAGPAPAPGVPGLVLRGVFRPLNKPYTLTLVPA
ncbi:MAG: hypothetical protein LBP43_06365 [Treponema sp.]|jgi:hypothetical protein|nr:hypothetical protein [Treponema sp.]